MNEKLTKKEYKKHIYKWGHPDLDFLIKASMEMSPCPYCTSKAVYIYTIGMGYRGACRDCGLVSAGGCSYISREHVLAKAPKDIIDAGFNGALESWEEFCKYVSVNEGIKVGLFGKDDE